MDLTLLLGEINQLSGDVPRLNAEVEATRDLGGRVQELEERQEFTERLLARARERSSLDAGG